MVSANRSGALTAGPRRVLLVDDDPLVRTTTASVLGDIGHEVTAVTSASEALAVLQSGRIPDLVITDDAMPGMTGTALGRLIRETWPELPVLIVTGYAQGTADGPSDLPRLIKPVLQEHLAAQIELLLAPKPTGNIVTLKTGRRVR